MIRFLMRCNRANDGEQQGVVAGRAVLQPTREIGLVSTDRESAPLDANVQTASFAATLVLAEGVDAAEFERIGRGRLVNVTIEVVDEAAAQTAPSPALASGGDAGGGSGAS